MIILNKTITTILLIILPLTVTVSYASEKRNTLKELGLINVAMINEILEPDKKTRIILKKILSNSTIKDAEVKQSTKIMLDELHMKINAIMTLQDLPDHYTWEKETTSIIVTLMILSEVSDKRGWGYYELARRYVFYDIKDRLSVENLCVLTTIRFYMDIKLSKDSVPRKANYFKKYMKEVDEIRDTYKKEIFKYGIEETTLGKPKLERFDKYYYKIMDIMKDFDDSSK
jgi:hypothetical protein